MNRGPAASERAPSADGSDLEIAPARASDLGAALRLAEEGARRHGYVHPGEGALRALLDREGGAVLVARRGGRVHGVVATQWLEWDSKMLGVPLGRAGIVALGEEAGGAPGTRLLMAARADAARRGWRALWLRIASKDAPAMRAVEGCRGELISTLVTYAFDLEGSGPRKGAPPGVRIRPAEERDVARLRELGSRAFLQGRYRRDPMLDAERVDTLWANSVENAMRGRASAVLVAQVQSAVEGFVTLHCETALNGQPAPGTGVIGLVAVSERAGRRGIGRSLVDSALSWFADTSCDTVEVGTQGDNAAAIQLYTSAGFRLRRLWLDYRMRLGPRA